MDIGLPPEDLKLMGRYYQNDLNLEVVDEDDLVSIVPPQTSRKSIMSMTVLLVILVSLLCGGAAWLFSTTQTEQTLASRLFTYAIIFLVWCLGVIGPYVAHTLRFRYLESISPLLAYDRRSGEVSMHAGSAHWNRDEVVAMIGLSSYDSSGEFKSELQLLTKKADKVAQNLIMTSMSGRVDRSFLKIIQQFCARSGIPGYVVEHKKQKNQIVANVRDIATKIADSR